MRYRCVTSLVRARQVHGALKVLQIMKLDIDANVVRQPTGEQLSFLEW